MTDHPKPLSRADREAHRALLEDALAELAGAPDPERAAGEVMRALDSYMEATGGGTALTPREAPVADFDRASAKEIRWVTWIVVGGAVLATAVVAIVLSGGWPAALAIIAIWTLALVALMSNVRPGDRPPSVIDALLDHGRRTPPSALGARPSLHLAVVACMDARLDPFSILGLGPGQAHVIRNAGGLVDDDALRSLAISQRLLGTREILIVQHTQCGLHGLDDGVFADEVAHDTGHRPAWTAGGFADLQESVRAQIRRARSAPELPHRDAVRGVVVDLAAGGVHEVVEDAPPA